MSVSGSKNEINSNINSICSCFDKLDNNIEKITRKIDEISNAFFKYSYNMSLQQNETNSYLKFQIELLKNEKAYYKKVKVSLKNKLVKDIYIIAESIVMLLGSIENIQIDNKEAKNSILKRVNSLKNYNSKIETSEVLELVNSTLFNLELIDAFVKVFDEFIKDTIKQNKRENLHCNNFKVTLENKQQHIILEHQKFTNKLEELVEYFLKCTEQLSEQLDHQKLLDFLVVKND